jgi:hypothetical protein
MLMCCWLPRTKVRGKSKGMLLSHYNFFLSVFLLETLLQNDEVWRGSEFAQSNSSTCLPQCNSDPRRPGQAHQQNARSVNIFKLHFLGHSPDLNCRSRCLSESALRCGPPPPRGELRRSTQIHRHHIHHRPPSLVHTARRYGSLEARPPSRRPP